MERQPALVELELLPCESAEARRRYGHLPWLGEELVVVADDGRAWIGPAAFLVALWALLDWRELSHRLASPRLLPLARWSFEVLSRRRARVGSFLGAPVCEGGQCGRR